MKSDACWRLALLGGLRPVQRAAWQRDHTGATLDARSPSRLRGLCYMGAGLGTLSMISAIGRGSPTPPPQAWSLFSRERLKVGETRVEVLSPHRSRTRQGAGGSFGRSIFPARSAAGVCHPAMPACPGSSHSRQGSASRAGQPQRTQKLAGDRGVCRAGQGCALIADRS